MTNDEAAILVEMAKRLRKKLLALPDPGAKQFYKAENLANTKKFIIQVFRGRMGKSKYNISLIFRRTLVLLRIDTGYAGVHYNTDNTVIPANTPHLHYYDENIKHENKCHNAMLLPPEFTNPSKAIQLLRDFLQYINIVDMEDIEIVQQGGLNYEI